MLAAATAAGVERFVYTSSSAAVIDATGLVAEWPVGPPALTDPYSTSKAAAERLVLDAAANGLPAMVVNPVGIYGPSPRGPQSYNALLLAAARGAEASGGRRRDRAGCSPRTPRPGTCSPWTRGEPGRRYVLCGEVATFGRVLHGFAERVGGARVADAAARVDAAGRAPARSPAAPRCTAGSRRCASTTPGPAGSGSAPRGVARGRSPSPPPGLGPAVRG